MKIKTYYVIVHIIINFLIMYSLYNNDMFDIFPTIEEKSIDLIFVDLPYNTTNCKWDVEVEVDLEKFWKESKRVLKDNGVVIATAQIPFSIKLGMSLNNIV